MARGSTAATTAGTTAQNQAGTLYGNANNLFGPLSAQLTTEAANPPGINPTDLARMDTAAMQVGGGSTAGAVGQGALKAARTRNAGGSDAAIAESVRKGGETTSKGILGNRVTNQNLKAKQQQEGMQGLNQLFAENLSGGNTAEGIVPQSVNANTNATNASWDWATDLFNPLLRAGSGAYGAYEGAH